MMVARRLILSLLLEAVLMTNIESTSVRVETSSSQNRHDFTEFDVDRQRSYKIEHLPSPEYCGSMTEQECEKYDKTWGQALKNRKFLTRRGRESLIQEETERRRNLSPSEQRKLQTGGVPQFPSTGTFNILVCLVQWSNHPSRNTVPRSDYELLFNGQGRDADKYPGGTVRDYFEAMSYGEFTINAHVTDWTMAAASEQTYTSDGGQGRTQELREGFYPILDALDSSGFDFSTLDADFDRVIDFIVFLHSGYDGTDGGTDCETGIPSAQRIASHARYSPGESSWTSTSGYQMGSYVVAPAYRGVCDLQIGRIGTIVHEMIHPFGLPDLYDVEGPMNPTGNLGGIDQYDVMANPSGQSLGDLAYPGHVSAWTRQEMGWVVPTEITADGTYTLRPAEKFPDVFIINAGFFPGEYLLIENRQAIAGDFDEKFFSPGGIAIYHIDVNIWTVFTQSNKGNYPRGGPFLNGWPANGYHYPVALLQADGLYELEQALNGGHSADLYNSESQSLGPGNGNTYPNTDSYAFGAVTSTGITLSNFRVVEGDMSMTFDVSGLGGAAPSDPPVAVPSDPPVEAPVAVPSDPPVEAPVAAPTDPPVEAPVAAPTDPPVEAPVAAPTDPPAETPTAPVSAPTNPPVLAPAIAPVPPSAVPGDSTLTPGEGPTNPPVSGLTQSPTSSTGGNVGSCDTGVTLSTNSSVSGEFIQSVDKSSNLESDGACQTRQPSVGGWYEVLGTGNIYTASACLLQSDGAATVSVFSGDCAGLTCTEGQVQQLATCGDEYIGGATLSWLTEPDQIYHVMVSGSTGPFDFEVSEEEVASNANCESAVLLSGIDEMGNTIGGGVHETCYGSDSQGLWYKLDSGSMEGGGADFVFELNTCFSSTNFHSTVSVYKGSCEALECVVTDRISCQNGKLGQAVYWATSSDDDYYIFVHADETVVANELSAGVFVLDLNGYLEQLNDDCADAISLDTAGTVVDGSTRGAKPDTSVTDGGACGIESAGVWYKVTGTGSGLQATTCLPGTDHPTTIHVFSGDCESLSCISVEGGNSAVCPDASVAGSSATVNWVAEDGVEYLILVGSRSGETGGFQLKVTEFETIPNDECSNSTLLASGSSEDGSTISATNDFPYGEICGLPLDTAGVWYSVQGTGSGISVTTCFGNDYDTAISVFTGSCDDLGCLTGTTSRDPSCGSLGVTASWLAEEGQMYYIYVHGNSPNSMGTFNLTMEQIEVIEGNEFCTQAIPAAVDGSRIAGSTKSVTHSASGPASCEGVEITNPSLWYTLEGTGDSFDVSACTADGSSDFDVSVSVYSGSCGDMTCVSGSTFAGQQCSDAETSNRTRFLQDASSSPVNLSFESEEGVTYYLLVHGQNPNAVPGEGGVGDFELYISPRIISTTAPTKPPSDVAAGEEITKSTNVNTAVTIELELPNVSILSEPKNGSAEVPSDEPGTVVYTPDQDFSGGDQFEVLNCNKDGEDCMRVPIVIDVVVEGSTSNGKNGLYALLLLLLLPVLWIYRKRIFVCSRCRQADDAGWDPTRAPSNRKLKTAEEGSFRDEPDNGEDDGYGRRDGKGETDDDDDDNDDDDDDDDDDNNDDEDDNDDDEDDVTADAHVNSDDEEWAADRKE
jgi:M6 family metalloprotease-like protein